MLFKEHKRVDTGQLVMVNYEGIDVLSDYEPKGKEKSTEQCVAVMRCGLVLHLATPKKSIMQAINAYRG